VLINLLSCAGCKIIVPDGEDVDLSTSNTVVYVELKAISDDSDPGPLYTYSTEGITSFEPGMEHYSKMQHEND
jgi:hypothetical protein